MRPLSLELEGFGPFRDRQRVEFADVELFVLTGPTGSGKTTLLDAIAFALYAKTPRGFRKYGELVHPAREVARVQLVFEAGGGVYRVTRAVGKGSEHRLERQEGAGFRGLPESEKVRALNERIERILGLSFDAFTRAILLPQGEFDRFLKGEPKERKALLAALFGLETLAAMRERARAEREAIALKLERVEAQLAVLAEAEGLAALREELAAKRAEQERLEAALAAREKELKRRTELLGRFQALADLGRELDALRAREPAMRALSERLQRARQAARLTPELARLEAEAERLEKLLSEKKALEERLSALKPAYQAAQERADPERLAALAREEARLEGLLEKRRWLERLGPPAGAGAAVAFDPLEVQSLLEARRAHAELDREERKKERRARELAALEAELERLGAEREAVTAEGRRARDALKEAEEALKEAELRAGLLAYHRHLRPGEPCPLCGQVVDRPPPAPPGPETLEPLRRRVEGLAARVEDLRTHYRELDADLKAKEGQAKRLKEELGALEAELKERRAALPDRDRVEARLEGMKRALAAELGGGDPSERLRALEEEKRRLKAALSERQRLEGEVGRLERELAGLSERAREAERGQRGLLEAFAARLAEAGFKDAGELKASRIPEAEAERLEAELEAYRRTRADLEARLAALKAELAGQSPPDPDALAALKEEVEGMKARFRRQSTEVGELTERLRRLEAEAERRRHLLKERAGLERELAVWEQLTADLRSDRFPEFLIDHYQRGLVARASELLGELYQGRYRLLAREGDYHVEDTWTRSVRSVRTLSGGESFLASLALALALSERISGGRLGALFLDEGFGTLDRETLEFAAGVLETLPTRGRLVGVVSHVAELAERFPERLVVVKSPSGSRVRWAD